MEFASTVFFRSYVPQYSLVIWVGKKYWSVSSEKGSKRGDSCWEHVQYTSGLHNNSRACFKSFLYDEKLNNLKFYTWAITASFSWRGSLMNKLQVPTTKFWIYFIIYRLCYQFGKVASALLSFCLLCSYRVLPFVLVWWAETKGGVNGISCANPRSPFPNL